VDFKFWLLAKVYIFPNFSTLNTKPTSLILLDLLAVCVTLW